MNAQQYISNQISQIKLQGKAGHYATVKGIVSQTRVDWDKYKSDQKYTELNEKVQRLLDKAENMANLEA